MLGAKRAEALSLHVKRLREEAKNEFKMDESYLVNAQGPTAARQPTKRTKGVLEVDFRRATLPNGLRVVTIPQPRLSRAHVALYLRVGSRFEEPRTNGLSHFLEHMIYRGTPRLPSAHAVNLAFETLGGYLYAATQADYGVFSVTLPPESLDEACALFGEVLRAPSFFDIEVEKGIVCEEILEDLDDEGRQIDADNISRELIYPEHPLGYTITGDEARVRSFTNEMCRAHHAKHYVAKNGVLAFSGNIDADRAVELGRARLRRASPGRGDARDAAGARAEEAAAPHRRERLVADRAAPVSPRDGRERAGASGDRAPDAPHRRRDVDAPLPPHLRRQGALLRRLGGYDGYEDDGIIDFAAGVLHSRAAPRDGRDPGDARGAGAERADGRRDGEGQAPPRLGPRARMLDSAEEPRGSSRGAHLRPLRGDEERRASLAA